MTSSDQLYRFIFDDSDVRGEIITLSDSYRTVLKNGNYPQQINELLGEFLVAAGLLSATMKFDGTITLQSRGDGPLPLIMSDCTRQHILRGIARLENDDEIQGKNFPSLVGNGHLAITVDPAQGERYQGIVPLEGTSLAACLEGYFQRSEQLPTRLWIWADGKTAVGLLLQALPCQVQTPEQRDIYWDHICALASTLTPEELLTLEPTHILNRLFHEEKLRLFESREMTFGCTCSESRTAQLLVTMGKDEVMPILEERGSVELNCQFCHQLYRFERPQIEALFSQGPDTVH